MYVPPRRLTGATHSVWYKVFALFYCCYFAVNEIDDFWQKLLKRQKIAVRALALAVCQKMEEKWLVKRPKIAVNALALAVCQKMEERWLVKRPKIAVRALAHPICQKIEEKVTISASSDASKPSRQRLFKLEWLSFCENCTLCVKFKNGLDFDSIKNGVHFASCFLNFLTWKAKKSMSDMYENGPFVSVATIGNSRKGVVCLEFWILKFM